MGRYYRKLGYSRGSEYARRHIEEAHEFSREIGGTDKDVKEYFFSLRSSQLESLLDEYGRKYGSSAKSYARLTYSKWKNGYTQMSGLVAKRLFSLLPPRMPLAKKYELAENVWNHFGPQSNHSFTIGVNTDVERVAEIVSSKLDQAVTEYNIPENIKNRFNWLSAGDLDLKEKLLNHFRQMQKRLAVEKARAEIPILQKQIRDHPDITGHVKSVLQINKHQVGIWIDKKLDAEIFEREPKRLFKGGGSGSDFNYGCLIWIAIIITVYLFFMYKG